ncbi:cell division protein FtsI (penicillin-binding protein 3) [Microbacterium resistens]|uniref:Cell division protein FtsI (Penicillin-binding protein 3) n=1 Tax=Microbacterium resistens TaxID=156977 RepID=A0ABU1SFR9_9MICO|nr:penicillin-binding protein 2 [Microbacterium resistens]MDR6867803.1 cell division protein FtsI (penicillin-binding protein 3) [Microbacterium resistens]
MTTRATRSPRRRTVVALAVILAVIAGFVVRLVDIQVVNAAGHVQDSIDTGEVGKTRTIAGARGSIVDMNGAPLAQGVLVYDAQLNPKTITTLEQDTKNPPKVPWEQASAEIAAITGQTPEEVRGIVADSIAANPDSQYARLKTSLSTDQFLKLKDLKLPYLFSEPRGTRQYPNGAVAGNLVGFVGSDGEALAGLEMSENSCLAPENGQETFLQGEDGVMIPGSHKEKPAVDGGTLRLTIDSELQWYLQQMIAEETQRQGAKSGTATVVEVKTGKIRAAAEYPSVDPNNVSASDPADLGSRIFTTTFEPGSTFKAITAASLMLHAGGDWSTGVSASSHEEFPNGAVVNDAFDHPSYDYTLAGALIDSSNVAMSKYGDMVTDQQRYDDLVSFGVGSKTAVDFPGEEPGLIHPVKDWDPQSHYTTTFGQYYTVTAPQVASAYQAIANKGVKIPLSLVESCTSADGSKSEIPDSKPERVLPEQTAAELSRMIENVAVQGGLADDIVVPGYRIAAKTGTAEKPDENGSYKAGIYFTSMVGYAPADDPQYVVIVTLDEPTRVTSSAATASAFQKAMTQVLKTYRVLPSSVPMDELLPKFK